MLTWVPARHGNPEQVCYLQNRAEHPWACMDVFLPPPNCSISSSCKAYSLSIRDDPLFN